MNLPMGSATWIAAGTDAAWTAETHMVAHLIDATMLANYQRGGNKGAQPKPIARPAEAKAEQEKRERAFVRASKFAARQKKKRAQPDSPTARPRDERGRFVSQKG